jgi:hypothetical protein
MISVESQLEMIKDLKDQKEIINMLLQKIDSMDQKIEDLEGQKKTKSE